MYRKKEDLPRKTWSTWTMDYLQYYRYLTERSTVEQAVVKYQRFASLPTTGWMDPDTIKQMKKLRCAIPDVPDTMRRFSNAAKWADQDLRYYISEFGVDLPSAQQTRIFSRALKLWSDVCGLHFTRTMLETQAHIKISFTSQAKIPVADNSFIPGRVFAHAYYPPDGRLYFNEDEMFTMEVDHGINLLWAAAHAFGHALGIDHSTDKDSIMYPYYIGYNPNLQITPRDQAAIQFLYGKNLDTKKEDKTLPDHNAEDKTSEEDNNTFPEPERKQSNSGSKYSRLRQLSKSKLEMEDTHM